MKEGAYLAPDFTVWHCVICGPVLRELFGEDSETNQRFADGTVTYHQDVPHPAGVDFCEETMQ